MTSTWTLHPGSSRVPNAAAPDVRARSYAISTQLTLETAYDGGVLIAHGDRNAGYALRVANRMLIHHYVHRGRSTTTIATVPLPVGRPVLVAAQIRRTGAGGELTLLADGAVVATDRIPALARARTGWTGVDIGCDRGLTVGCYPAPGRFTGRLGPITVIAEDDQWLDEAAVWALEDAAG